MARKIISQFEFYIVDLKLRDPFLVGTGCLPSVPSELWAYYHFISMPAMRRAAGFEVFAAASTIVLLQPRRPPCLEKVYLLH